MITLLKQLIYPTLEYNCILWNPTDTVLINLLESIQSNFIKKIFSPTRPQNSDYWDLLSHYKLYSMQRRRERYSIFYVWKVIHNLYPNPGLNLNHTTQDHKCYQNEGISLDVHTRLGITAHHHPYSTKWLKDKSPLNNCCYLYNCLPPKLRQPTPARKDPSFPQFKKAVDDWLVEVPDQPSCSGRPKIANSLIHQHQFRPRPH